MPNQVTLITGGNGAIATAIAREMLETDAQSIVYLGIRKNRERAESLAAEFQDRVQLLALDVIDPKAWTAAIEQILDTQGRLDVLINNAGGHHDALLAMMEPEDWSSVIDSNLNAAFHGCRAVVKPMMSQRYGRIVNVASLSALMAPAGQTNYAAAKAGLVAFTQSLAKEVARAGITVNAVCPGFIDTPALESMPPEQLKARRVGIPMRRFGKPEEVAAAVCFLASPKASYITGSTLRIDGGIL